VVLEDAKELPGGVHDCVRLLGFELCRVVDPAPRHRDGEHACGLRRADVERRVADVRRIRRVGSEALCGQEKRFRVGLLLLRLVASDNRLEEVSDGHAREAELDGRTSLRGDDAEAPTLLAQLHENVFHAGARLELVVERLVVRAVDVHEPVDVAGGERAHLRFEAGTADRPHQLGVRVLVPEHFARRVPHRGEDDRAGVDDRAVEVEENGPEPHASIVSAPPQ
jgi:hypothetical protein